jgi:hypothetical protein
MHDFLFWLYDSLIISLLRNNFYITETSPHKSRVFYYRRYERSHFGENLLILRIEDNFVIFLIDLFGLESIN